jgi:hypothetical protein
VVNRSACRLNPATTPQLKFYMPSIQAAASSLAIEANSAPVHSRDEIEGVIAAQARNPGGGLQVMPDIFNVANSESIIALAARSGVPAIYPIPFLRNQAASSPMAPISRNGSAKRGATSIAS